MHSGISSSTIWVYLMVYGEKGCVHDDDNEKFYTTMWAVVGWLNTTTETA